MNKVFYGLLLAIALFTVIKALNLGAQDQDRSAYTRETSPGTMRQVPEVFPGAVAD